MNQFLSLPILERDLTSQRVVEIVVSGHIVAEFSLKLTLLERGLVASISLRPYDPKAGPEIRLRTIVDAECNGRAIAFQRGSGVLDITLSATELGAWLTFFLQAYRDGAAAVDHLDLDIGHPSLLTLVVKTDRVRAPVSADEARRTLQSADP